METIEITKEDFLELLDISYGALLSIQLELNPTDEELQQSLTSTENIQKKYLSTNTDPETII